MANKNLCETFARVNMRHVVAQIFTNELLLEVCKKLKKRSPRVCNKFTKKSPFYFKTKSYTPKIGEMRK